MSGCDPSKSVPLGDYAGSSTYVGGNKGFWLGMHALAPIALVAASSLLGRNIRIERVLAGKEQNTSAAGLRNLLH